MSKLHPLFQSITDSFVSIPEKIAAASVVDAASEREQRDPNGCPTATPDNAGNHGGGSSKNAYRPSREELLADEMFEDKLAMYRGEY